MQSEEGIRSRRGGLIRQVQVALRRASPILSRAGSYIGRGMDIICRWAWVASRATWVFAYPLLRGRQHQSQIDAAYRNLIAQRTDSLIEARSSRYQHQ